VLETVLGIVIGPSGVGWAKPDVVLARELLYRLEPELYGQVASAERLHLEVVGWLLRHVRPRDAMTVGPPPATAGSFRLPGVSLGFTGLFLAGYASGDAVARLRRAGAGGHNPDTGLGVVVNGSRGRHQWCWRRPVVAWSAGDLDQPGGRVIVRSQPGGPGRGVASGR